MKENERLWRIWWLWGIPTAWATSALVIAAEAAYGAGHGGWGNFLDLARFLVYWCWMRAAWRCATNVENRIWTFAARVALATGLVVHALA